MPWWRLLAQSVLSLMNYPNCSWTNQTLRAERIRARIHSLTGTFRVNMNPPMVIILPFWEWAASNNLGPSHGHICAPPSASGVFLCCCSVGQCSYAWRGCSGMRLQDGSHPHLLQPASWYNPAKHAPQSIFGKVNSTLPAGECLWPPFTDFIHSSCQSWLPDTGLIFSPLRFLDFQPCLLAD